MLVLLAITSVKRGLEGSTVEEKRARALLRYFTWRIAVAVRTKTRRYAIGKVNIRYNDMERRDETPFVDNAVKPPICQKKTNYLEMIPNIATNPRSIMILFCPWRRERYANIIATMQQTVK